MEKQEKLGALVVWNNDLHIYELTNENEIQLQDFIKRNTSREISTLNVATGVMETTYEPIEKIENESDNKLVWKLRRNLNAKKKEIETKRKQAVAIMINDFVACCKTMEKEIDDASKRLTTMLNEYKPKETAEKQKYFVLKVASNNMGLIQKLEGIAMSMGLEVETSEEER